MAGGGPAVDESTLGAWLVKARPEGLPLDEVLQTGFQSITTRCVRPTYRADLVRRGQPVLLWVSGGNPRRPAGIYAAGLTTGPVQLGAGEPAMPVELRALEPIVTRDEVLAVPGLADIEVVRMPAGSNPSYIDVEHYRTLLAAFPHVGTDHR